ncbi:MAG TPA: hypothetical protein VF981_01845 [Gemmatimonadaceae bacterium]
MIRRRFPSLVAVVLIACGGSAGESDSTVSSTGPAELVITARDFAFEMPDTVPAGLTHIRLLNQGPQLHHAQLIRFAEGRSLADMEAHLKSGATSVPSWMEEVGGPNPPEVGMETSTTQMLEPGNYAVVCFVDLPDRVPHVMKGMAMPFVVVPSTAAAAPEPTPTVSMTLNDYAFGLSAPLTAGHHVVRVDNGAAQAHEVAVLQLKPGKTLEDFTKFGETYQGEMPATSVGGIAGIKGGSHAWFEVDLTPGDYLLVCFVLDATDGKPHLMHGMLQPFSIS